MKQVYLGVVDLIKTTSATEYLVDEKGRLQICGRLLRSAMVAVL